MRLPGGGGLEEFRQLFGVAGDLTAKFRESFGHDEGSCL